MKRKVLVTTMILLAIVMVTAYLHSADLQAQKQSQEQATVTLKAEGIEVSMNMDAIRAIGEESFDATIRSSSRPASDHVYKGVPLKDILAAAGIELNEGHQVLVKAVDGFVVALMGSEVLDEDNAYLAYIIDGDYLGTREQGGNGPYQLIIRNDPFSQRWCKFVMEVQVK